MQEYTAVIKHQAPWWFGWIEEIPGVNGQEQTREALLETLRENLREAIQMNRDDALRSAADGYTEESVAV